MDTIHIRKQLTSHTLELPELAPLVGRVVEIRVVEVPAPAQWEPGTAAQFTLHDDLDLGPLGEAVLLSGALSRLA